MINNNIKPIKHYNNIIKAKPIIFKDNKNKSGIYKWTNKTNNKFYIGSAINLSSRLKDYLRPKCLEKFLVRSKSKIYNGLLKYGYDNFRLEILEYCELNVLIEREQYYFDLLKPEYNICKIAGSSFGKKHTPETILKMKAYKPSVEAIDKLRQYRLNTKHSLETNLKISSKLKGRVFSLERITKMKLNPPTGVLTTILNIKDHSEKEYFSVVSAARDLSVCVNTINKYANTGKLFKDTFLINRAYRRIKKVANKTPVIIENILTKETYELTSIKEVANKFNVSYSTIRHYIINNKLYRNIYCIKYKIK